MEIYKMLLQKRSLYFFGGMIFAFTISNLPKFINPSHISNLGDERTKIRKAILFGDSITQEASDPARDGWVSSLSAYWIRRVDIFNRGFGGYNSRWGMKIYQSVVLDHRPDIIFLFFRANDSVCEEVPQHVPLLEYKDNLSSMVEQAQSTLPYSTIIILSPPPVYEPLLEERNKEKKKKILSDRVCSRTREYVKACVEVGAKFNVDVIDNFTSMEGDSKNRSDYLRDGLHLNSKGNAKVYENVINLIEKKYKQLDPENMQMYQPHWSEIVANPDIL